MTTLTPGGICPNEPEDPISEEAYDSVIAAMDRLIAAADARPATSDEPEGVA